MTARIYKPARNAMQSGKGASDFWILENVREEAPTKDPLMGWTSGDTSTQVKLRFETQAEAEDYAKRNGIAYTVTPVAPVRINKKSYSDNFKFGRTTLWTH
ncbi:MAG: ETC complex I subunit [Alphaproteobacteria bacterium]|nr:ETC complex I subunit [Alphaproteobacteria bacterium]